jgi:uncharacterized protein (TIGR03000 family)
MYGVILMAAMATTQSAPDLGWKSCRGCNGCCGYSGCRGCSGCHGGGCHGNYGACYGGCYGSCYGGWESMSPSHTPAGCWGMPYSGYGPSWPGYACAGGCGGYQSAAYGAPGPVIATPAPEVEKVADPKEVKPKVNPKKNTDDDDDDQQVSTGGRARVIVSLPANGKLFVDNMPIRNAAEIKTFRTPALSKGQQYYYEMRAEVLVNGKVVTQTRHVTVAAGEVIRADFSTLGTATGVAANSR